MWIYSVHLSDRKIVILFKKKIKQSQLLTTKNNGEMRRILFREI